ncbi:hypothetical protein XELAEV_18045220mg [Xenopus laevis]|uniref:Uncharacterized protein n=1 Tax=Xenopus laevis TaxID=8355 RepID=A0A974C0B2_XENLA|nr:hypothetical protein XELAEV_18045220mg [Xenopus laevis]
MVLFKLMYQSDPLFVSCASSYVSLKSRFIKAIHLLQVNLPASAEIKHLIPAEDMLKLIHAFVPSTVDYRNNQCHITPVLHCLHRFPIKWRIVFTIGLVAFAPLGPVYVEELLISHVLARPLCSSESGILKVPRVTLKSYGSCVFFHTTPTVWNSLPIIV